MVKLTMEPVTRIEGHAKITVHLDESGNVEDTRLHVMEFRGFEKFLQGRNIEEVPRIVPRICGICDVQHHFAAAKAVDQIFGFKDDEILPAAYKMREIMNWGSYMHSHALHFYFLAAPDLIIPDGTRKTRNVFQVIKDMPEIALQAIKIRRNGLDIVSATGGRPIHPTSSTPGGISTELDEETQADLLAKAKENVELAQATIELAVPILEEKIDLVKTLGYFGDTRHCGLVTEDGDCDVYNGKVRIKDKDGSIYTEYRNLEYKDIVAEHVKPYSWLKFPYIKELGYPEGIYRVANMSLETKKYQQALEYYSRLLGDGTYNNDAIIGLANTYYEMAKDTADSRDYTTNKDVYLAYDYVNEAIQRTPNDLKLHLAKIKLGKLTHQMELTEDNLNYIVQSASDSLMDTVIKGEAYLSLGREKDAVYTFENAINFANSIDDELYLSEILVQHKQFRTARKALQKVLMAEPDNRIALNGIHYIDLCEMKSNEFFEIALRQYKEGNYASTVEYCNRAIDFYHNAPSIAKLKAQAYEAEKNYEGAVKYYTQYLALAPNASDKAAVEQRIQVFRQRM